MDSFVEIISTERITPSSPTPNHLRSFKLCSLDHLIPAPYAPIVLFYPNHDGSARSQALEKISRLKKSLSETLSRFFPLAGTVNSDDDLSIDCDDHGARFTTAKVNKYHLAEFLDGPDLVKMLVQLLPRGLTGRGSHPVSNIQASVFECGGIAVGTCISHKIIDGTALSNFLRNWADAARSSDGSSVSAPDSSASSLFPIVDSSFKNASMAMWGALFKKGRFVTKRFVFDGSAIASLTDQLKYFENSFTRVEVVSGFIWKHAMAEMARPSLLTHVVNLRKRASPHFPESSLGNLIWMAAAKCNAQELGNVDRLPTLVDRVRKSITRIDGDYVKKLQGEEGSRTMHKFMKEIQEFGVGDHNVDYFGFTSWCKLGFYDVDFGWGRPVWVSSIDSSGSYFMNLAVLMDTRCGTGIEAWMTMDEEEMSRLECNEEFRKFASLNPRPLDLSK